MRDYIHYKTFFLESFDSNVQNTLIVELKTKLYFIAICRDLDILKFIKENKSELLTDLSLVKIAKKIKESLSEFQKFNDMFFAVLNLDTNFICFLNFNIDYICLKKGDKIEVLDQSDKSSESEFNISKISLKDLEFMFVSNSKRAGSIFKKEIDNIFFPKDIEKLIKTNLDKPFSFLYLNNILTKTAFNAYTYNIKATKENIDKIESKVDKLFENKKIPLEQSSNIMIIFNELLINAYEHGSLCIGGDKKQKLIEENKLDDFKKQKEQEVNSDIYINITFFNNGVLNISIEDKGEGFDYKSCINPTDHDFRGRGLIMSRSMSNALYFGKYGRKVSFFFKIKHSDPANECKIDSTEFYTNKLKFLYVEDDKFIMTALSRVLKKYTGNLLTATDGQEGLDMFLKTNPDIIITDIEMPNMNGLDMSRKIKKINPDVPIVLTTAYNDTDTFIEAIDIGVDKFLIKPIKMEMLESVLFKLAKNIFFKNEAEKLMAKERKELLDLRVKDESIISAQRIASEKEQLIIEDDKSIIKNLKIDLYYKPLEILSGDIYGICKIDEHQSIIYIVDSMGKGLGASVTATLSAAFINRSITLSIRKNNFLFNKLILDYIDYIKSYLLDYEAVSFTFLMLDTKENIAKYSSFGMYPIIFKNRKSNKLTKIKSNNPPLLKYLSNYKISSFKLTESFNMYLYSDGIIESEQFSMQDLIQNFKKYDNFEDFNKSIKNAFKQDDDFEDDITSIFISKG